MPFVFLSLFSGINLAFALLSFFIVSKNKSQLIYRYFGIFSLFFGSYFLLLALSGWLNIDLRIPIIFCAAIYYGVFPFFIFSFIDQKRNNIAYLLASIFVLAFTAFVLLPDLGKFPVWQIIAHLGLLGLLILAVYASRTLIVNKEKGAMEFAILTFLFLLLGVAEILDIYLGKKMISQMFGGFFPLDIYPLLFTLLIGRQLSLAVYAKNRLKIQLMASDLTQKELEIEQLEKKKLQDELFYKSKDLTDFGVEITRKKDFTQKTLHGLIKLKKTMHSESPELDELIKYTKAQTQIDKDLELFHAYADTVNHEFIDKLKSTFPSLTENELHLASLLRIKLSTKEIASIKNITADSAKVLRHRLRKKFNLPQNKSLVNFLIDLK